MASPLIRIDDSSMQVRDVIGNNNEVYLAKYTVDFHSLNPEVTESIEKALTRIMRDKLIHESQVEGQPIAVEGTDILALHEPLQELGDALEQNEVNSMITMFCMACKVATLPASAQDLFTSLIHSGKLRLQDFTFLQSLLWKAGRRDLFKILAEKAQELQELHEDDDPPLRISHLDAPSLTPIEGYRYVKFHLKVDLLDIGPERLQKLEKELARLLGVPRKFIAVMGVEPDQSAWVTVIMPFPACKALELQFDAGGIQNELLKLDIDKVGFFPDPNKDMPLLTCNQESLKEGKALQAQGGSIPGKESGWLPVKEGRWVDGAVYVTFRLEDRELEEPHSPKPHNVQMPVGLLKEEMEDVLEIDSKDQVWVYLGEELEDDQTLEDFVLPSESHIEIFVKVRSSSESD